MPDVPEAVITAAAEAIMGAANMDDGESEWWESRHLARAALVAAAPLLAGAVVTEHAQLMSGGGYHVRNSEPYIEEIYPLEKWIKAGQRSGGKVYRRLVIVVEDWTEVPPGEGCRP